MLLLLTGVTMWVGIRVGKATVWERGRAPDPPPSLIGGPLPGRIFLRDGHSAVADIDVIAGDVITATARGGEQRVIYVTPETMVLRGAMRSPTRTRVGADGLAQFAELQPGARIIALGRPRDDGAMEARLIHIVPPDFPLDPPPMRTPPFPDRRRREGP
jgi:hypothetical protein